MSYLYYSDKEKPMTLYSIKSMPCPNECVEGRIIEYNVYELNANGLPSGRNILCDVCDGKGYVVCSSELPEAN